MFLVMQADCARENFPLKKNMLKNDIIYHVKSYLREIIYSFKFQNLDF